MTTTNPYLQELIQELKDLSRQEEVPLWKRVAKDLERPTRERRVVNLFHLDSSTQEDDAVVVPGKVLGTGSLSHKLTVAAFDFSGSARRKIEESGGSCLDLDEYMKKNPKAQDVRLIG